MKALLISDSHGAAQAMQALMIRMEGEGRPDALIYCGDGIHDILHFRGFCPLFFPVRGNCDLGCDPAIPLQRIERLQGIDVLITHGHLDKVKWGLSTLLYRAQEAEARICCFGHTHRALAEWVDGVLMLNPGSLGKGEFALLTIREDGSPIAALRRL
ncbi:MAG: metallophosphoesterase family protein [Christensenellales bacterium]